MTSASIKNRANRRRTAIVKLIINFDVPFGKRNQQYKIVWNNFKYHHDYNAGIQYYHYETESDFKVLGNTILSYSAFWWTPSAPYGYNNYGCSIYEGETINGKWVREDWGIKWIFTLTKRRRTFPLTILLTVSILSCPFITARLIGIPFPSRCSLGTLVSVGRHCVLPTFLRRLVHDWFVFCSSWDMKMHLQRNGNRVFTLIELLVVIAIIGILASLLLTASWGAPKPLPSGLTAPTT